VASTPVLSIVGPSKVGTAIGVLARRAGYEVAAIGGRDLAKTMAAAERIGGGVEASTPFTAAAAGELVLLAVSDDAIGELCDQLVGAGAFAAGAVVGHCSGALGSDILHAARERCGCHVASVHPLQTFPTAQSAIDGLAGVYWFSEGDESAVKVLNDLIAAIGGKPVGISSEQKPLYHAAAVFACNYLTALMDMALATARGAGVESHTAWEALEPLVRNTVTNVGALGPPAALTGPIARGDTETVLRHQNALREYDPELARLYSAFGRWTIELARRKGSINESAAEALRGVLGQPFV
jgi:predicted short-subunit dehydrogenase-like oxidoreductase (DUF2520 family)